MGKSNVESLWRKENSGEEVTIRKKMMGSDTGIMITGEDKSIVGL